MCCSLRIFCFPNRKPYRRWLVLTMGLTKPFHKDFIKTWEVTHLFWRSCHKVFAAVSDRPFKWRWIPPRLFAGIPGFLDAKPPLKGSILDEVYLAAATVSSSKSALLVKTRSRMNVPLFLINIIEAHGIACEAMEANLEVQTFCELMRWSRSSRHTSLPREPG